MPKAAPHRRSSGRSASAAGHHVRHRRRPDVARQIQEARETIVAPTVGLAALNWDASPPIRADVSHACDLSRRARQGAYKHGVAETHPADSFRARLLDLIGPSWDAGGMTQGARRLIAEFDALPEQERSEVLTELARRVGLSPHDLPRDEDLLAAADQLFVELDRRESTE